MTKKLSINQKAFNKVYRHLLTQKKKSESVRTFGNDGTYVVCAYRGKDNLKCAVGCLISNKVYTSRLEGRTVDQPSVEKALEKSGWIGVTPSLLKELQSVHDIHQPWTWPQSLKKVAEFFDLKIPSRKLPYEALSECSPSLE